jgi:hypothetical protein
MWFAAEGFDRAMRAAIIVGPERVGVVGRIVVILIIDAEVLLVVSVSAVRQENSIPWDGAHIVLAGHCGDY